jgi:hypothetical protein
MALPPSSLRGNNPIPAVPVTITATGGRHLFFRNTEGLTNARGDLPAGIDVRGVGGFVVAPGSAWENYAWRAHPKFPRLMDVYPDLPRLPDWLVRVVRPPQQANKRSPCNSGDGGLRALCVRVLNSREGERNNVLFWAACRARDEGGSDFARSMLLEAARRAGLPETEARRTITSGFKQRKKRIWTNCARRCANCSPCSARQTSMRKMSRGRRSMRLPPSTN